MPTPLLEIEYKKHPRIFWAIFVFFGLIFLFVQSYFAEPRPFVYLFMDLVFPTVAVFSILFLLAFPKNVFMLLLGLLYFFLTAMTLLLTLIPLPYGTFFFLMSVWFMADWFNYEKFKKSVFSEIVSGNYNLASGVFLSAFVFGLAVEAVNLRFLLWEYTIPFPYMTSYGVFAVMAGFRWVIWTCALLSVFYPFVYKSRKRFHFFKK